MKPYRIHPSTGSLFTWNLLKLLYEVWYTPYSFGDSFNITLDNSNLLIDSENKQLEPQLITLHAYQMWTLVHNIHRVTKHWQKHGGHIQPYTLLYRSLNNNRW